VRRWVNGHRRQAAGLVVTAGLAVAALLSVLFGPGAAPASRLAGRPTSKASDLPPTSCRTVTLLTGQEDTPYFRYGNILKAYLERSGHDWTVSVPTDSSGSVDNLQRLERDNCALALTQMNVAVDAVRAKYLFAKRPILDLVWVAPVYYDLLHIFVLRSSGISTIKDLCGLRVDTGKADSGTQQLTDVLRRVPELQTCPVYEKIDVGQSPIDKAMTDLFAGSVKAVIWAGASPTQPVQNAIEAHPRQPVAMLDASGLRPAFQDDFANLYYPVPGDPTPAPVFTPAVIAAGDYQGLAGPVPTFEVANAFVARTTTDPELTRLATKGLLNERDQLAGALWTVAGKGKDGDVSAGRHFPDPAVVVCQDPTFRYLPPAAAARSSYPRDAQC
jgi:TRAP transporter TAXI family solute receptor